jgi:hypothetical protein
MKSGNPQEIERSANLLAQIVARETGQSVEDVMTRLRALVSGGQQ